MNNETPLNLDSFQAFPRFDPYCDNLKRTIVLSPLSLALEEVVLEELDGAFGEWLERPLGYEHQIGSVLLNGEAFLLWTLTMVYTAGDGFEALQIACSEKELDLMPSELLGLFLEPPRTACALADGPTVELLDGGLLDDGLGEAGCGPGRISVQPPPLA